jgi:DNA ligase-1
MNVLHQTPIIQKTNSKGQELYWEGYAAKSEEKGCYIYSISWQSLAGGNTSARTISDERKVKGKNIGRSNETTDEEQAIFEIQVKEREKRDQGFHAEGEVAVTLPFPMLAHVFYDVMIDKFDKYGTLVESVVKTKGQKKKIKFPCGLQPKFDGVRCLMNSEKAWSRNGKLWKPEIVGHLMFDTNGSILDGELILSPEAGGFQKTTSAVTKVSELTPHLQYYVYDCLPDENNITSETSYEQRYKYLEYMFRSAELSGLLPENVILVKTVNCKSEEHAVRLHDKCTARGYEGAMVRNWNAPYAIDKRSYDLQKIKVFITEEFEIIDCIDGKGTDEEAIMYVCKTEDGTLFKVRPSGTIKGRKELWLGFCEGTYDPIGKMYTVKFQNYTDKGKPRFPAGLGVRDYE